MSSEAITRNDLKAILDEVLITKPPVDDYVVEHGIDGIWTYRKWNSGIAECWGITPEQSYPLSSSYGSAYYSSHNPFCTFPAGLFINTPAVNIMRTGGRNGQGLISISVYGINSNNCSCYVWNTLSGALTMSFSVIAKGRWK